MSSWPTVKAFEHTWWRNAVVDFANMNNNELIMLLYVDNKYVRTEKGNG